MSAASTPYSAAQWREAAEWFVLVRNEQELSSDALQSWLRWLEAQEGNRLAFEAVAALWHGMPPSIIAAMPSDRDSYEDEYTGETPVHLWRKSERSGGPWAMLRQRPLWQRWAALAASLLVVVSCAVVLARFLERGDRTELTYETRTGEQMQLALADGSRVWLGPRSRLFVSFSAVRRRLSLDDGEGFFQVKKDVERPFIVHTARGDVTAVGTAFDVRAINERITVAVNEGAVSVAVAPSGGSDRSVALTRVASGQEVTLDPRRRGASVTVRSSAAPGERARWREGILVYRDDTLRDVIADVARYSKETLEVAEDGSADLRFSGVVYEDSIAEWVHALPESFRVRVDADGTHLRIRRR